MKLLWWCIVAALLTISSAAVDVEKTVKQVQSILNSNTLLPRLTREEIINLLNDIKEEDAKDNFVPRKNSNTISITTTSSANNKINKGQSKYKNLQDNEIATQLSYLEESNNSNVINSGKTTNSETLIESTTQSGSTLTVVLPYTPRDGSSLQELYTKPPRLQVVTEKINPKPSKTTKLRSQINQTARNKNTNKQKLDLPAELQAFLDAHGLRGKPGQDNFLLPLEGFKPLPAPKVIDGTVQLPENLLLTYDLISPSDLLTSAKGQTGAQTNFLYEPLKPQFPFELDTSSSETKHSILPLDLPQPRKPKSVSSTPKPSYEPIDYEAVKVIPLSEGPIPTDDEVVVGIDQSKRQTNETENSVLFNATSTETTNQQTETKNAEVAEKIPDLDTGASIADLEDSFGGAAPVVPGDSELPPPKKNGFYWMLDWNSFLEVGDDDKKVNIRFEPKFGDPQMFLPVNVP